MKRLTRFAAMALVAAGAGVISSSADAAVMLDVRVTAVTGGTFTSKTAAVAEGGTVTVGIYLQNLSDANAFGLGSYQTSVRSFNERYNAPGSPTAFTGGPTAAATVMNATALNEATLPAGFDGASAKILADIHATLGNPDPSDTDTDATKLGKAQTPGGEAYSVGFGVGGEVLLGTATFTALDLDDAAFAVARTVSLNTYWTALTGTNGGAVIQGLTGSDTATNGLSTNLITSAAQIGSDVQVTVGQVPEPAALGLITIGLLGVLRRQRRSEV